MMITFLHAMEYQVTDLPSDSNRVCTQKFLTIADLKPEDEIDTKDFTQLLSDKETSKRGFAKKQVKLKIFSACYDQRDDSDPKFQAKYRDYGLEIFNSEGTNVGKMWFKLFSRFNEYDTDEPWDKMKISDLIIIPEFRNQGYGLSALSGLIEFTKKTLPEGLTKICLRDLNHIEGTHVAGLYPKLGFEKMGQSQNGTVDYRLQLGSNP